MKKKNFYLLRLAKDYFYLISISLEDEPDESIHLCLAKDLLRIMTNSIKKSTITVASNCLFVASTSNKNLEKLDLKKTQDLFKDTNENVLHIKYVKKELVEIKKN
jgi:hypothetical protein